MFYKTDTSRFQLVVLTRSKNLSSLCSAMERFSPVLATNELKNEISQQILVYLIICKKNEEIIISSVRHGRDGLRGFSWGLVRSTAAADGRSFGGVWETFGRVMFWIVLTSEELFTHWLVHLRNSVTVAGRHLASFLIFLRKSYKNFPFNIPVFLKNLNEN